MDPANPEDRIEPYAAGLAEGILASREDLLQRSCPLILVTSPKLLADRAMRIAPLCHRRHNLGWMDPPHGRGG